MPSPTSTAARISENVYVVAPNSSVNKRVQITSAPSAVAPDRAMARNTGPVPAGMANTEAGVASSGCASYAVTFASASPASATITLSATATYVATALSNNRSR